MTGEEFGQVRKLAVFLIGALLPSDALIRFGRSLFMQGQTDPQSTTTVASPPTAMPRATLPQYLAFAAFVVVTVMTLISNDIVSTNEFDEVNKVAVFLIAALLPSEAAIRFGRALYLGRASAVTAEHLKRI